MSGLVSKNIWQQLNNLALVRFLLLVACGWAIVQLLAYFETVIVIFTFNNLFQQQSTVIYNQGNNQKNGALCGI